MNDYINYAVSLGASEEVIGWITTTLKNKIEKENPEIAEVEHIIDYVVEFLEYLKIDVRDSEMLNLGCVDISDVEDDNAVFPDLFRDKYFYKGNKILDKQGNKYQSVSLWSKFNVFDLNLKLNIKWNFDIALSVKTFIKNVEKITSKNYTQQASSGDSTQHILTGEHSIAAAIGVSSKIKGIKGTWITLAEYKDNKPVLVKSAQIDGVTLKENVFYKLENGQFVEVPENN